MRIPSRSFSIWKTQRLTLIMNGSINTIYAAG